MTGSLPPEVEESKSMKIKICENDEKPCELYSYWRSSCSYRVRIALNMKNIPYNYKEINLIKDGGDQYLDEYSKINKNNRVPLLHIDEKFLTQSNAIIEYLEESRPFPSLLPENIDQRFQVREIVSVIGSDIQPVQNLNVLKKLMSLVTEEEKQEIKMSWGKECISRGFRAVESLLEKYSGKYCIGDTITIADIFLLPQVYNAHRFKVNINEFPMITKIAKTLEEIPAFQNAHPSKMPDAILDS